MTTAMMPGETTTRNGQFIIAWGLWQRAQNHMLRNCYFPISKAKRTKLSLHSPRENILLYLCLVANTVTIIFFTTKTSAHTLSSGENYTESN